MELCSVRGGNNMDVVLGPTPLTNVKTVPKLRKDYVKCEICSKNTKNIEIHMNMEHTKVKTIECDVCNKKFMTPDLLRKHKVSHISIDKRKQTCPQCGVKVVSLNQHNRMVHQKEFHIPCTEKDCNTMFVTNHGLEQHIRNVHEKAKLACPQCEIMLGVGQLKRHIRIVHDKRRDHNCIECKKTFQTKTHLNNHVSRVHRKIREKCPDCGKLVQDVKSHHRFVHQKVKNFPCEHCDSRFITSTMLREHVNNFHLDEHLPCPECGKMVKYLYHHLRKVHQERNKYRCSQCKKSYTHKTDLSKHMIKAHMKNQTECSPLGLMISDNLPRNLRESDLQDYTKNRRKLQLETKLDKTGEVMDLLEDKPAVIDRLAKQKLSGGIGVLSCKEENKDIFSLQSEDQFCPPVEILDTVHEEDKVKMVKLKFR